ncbi:MAG: sugar ABC transporter ATP-binding protein [Gammaproteobacteria bacterium]|nr:MAG: sugar ABC transporter ATP-binding protein [Gammaproteobacteria bacterium]
MSHGVLEVDCLSKDFPGLRALDHVSLRLRSGTVHALMGENGAGKSTLMRIIAGDLKPTSGQVRLRGRACEFSGPRAALLAGIAMIHQELNLVPGMTVAENIWIGREPRTRLGLINHRELHRRTSSLLEQLAIELDPGVRLGDLGIAQQQMIEIARAASWDSDVLLMDEPTSSLTDREVCHLFALIRQLKGRGKAIVYITHKMSEVFEIADEISILRDGRQVATAAADKFVPSQLVALMVGRELEQLFPKTAAPIGATALAVHGLSLAGVLSEICFELRRGETLGVAGLVGAGRTNLAETLFGLTPATAGQIHIDGREVVIDSPQRAIGHGIAFLTEDRKRTGLFPALSVLENIQIASLPRFTHHGFVHERALSSDCRQLCETLHIKVRDLDDVVMELSGGNQQKVLIARWLLTHPRILILDEPTRGVDVAAKAEIHRLMSQLASRGVAVILISSELPEVLAMSDRILVMHQGRVSGVLERAEATQEKVLELAAL